MKKITLLAILTLFIYSCPNPNTDSDPNDPKPQRPSVINGVPIVYDGEDPIVNVSYNDGLSHHYNSLSEKKSYNKRDDFRDTNYQGLRTHTYKLKVTSIGFPKEIKTMEIASISITGDNSNDFILDTSNTVKYLNPGDTTQFSVTFNPKARGFRVAYITIRSNCRKWTNSNGEVISNSILNFRIAGFCTDYYQIEGDCTYTGNNPGITMDNHNNVYAVYYEHGGYDVTNFGLQFAKSKDWGSNWTWKKLDYGQHIARFNSIKYGNNILHLAYTKNIDPPGWGCHYYFMRSTDHGDTWKKQELISGNYGRLEMEVDNNHVMFWIHKENHYLLKQSFDNGITWTNTIVNAELAWSKIKKHNNKLYLLFLYPKKNTIHLLISDNNGQSWSENIFRTQTDFNNMRNLSIMINNTGIFFTYQKDYSLMFAKSLDNGNTWDFKTLVQPSGIFGVNDDVNHVSDIVDADGKIVICYQQKHLKVAESIDNGMSWTFKTLDDSGSSTGGESSMIYHNGKINILYYEAYKYSGRFFKY